MIKFCIISLFLFFVINDKKNINIKFLHNQFIVDTTKPSKKKKEFFDKNIIGSWCFAVGDSIDFEADFMRKNDSLFCNYVNVMDNGNFLNATDDYNDWAFKIPIKEFNTSISILMTNHYNDSKVHLKLRYSYFEKKLIWNIIDKDYEKTFMLPRYLKLDRCTNN